MTYLVLARKWRPRSFDTLIGQDHVVRALTHALTTQRLHHAWLFTGTRGVGKTTLSRILAKALNCETGITAAPCGQCRACVEIDEGRFVDYVELDAASNRGVDEMTQLLEQAVYAPSSGRYKVYMIDEVHMLTGHAFNAMLKTLEEPPAHVKFILATTDPQKIPVTVLSRCLQFNLKQMTVPAIVSHLELILQQEEIPFEVPGLRLIAQAAAGSMRDALSLTDQAIAYSAASVSTEAVQGMLGTIDQGHLCDLLDALMRQDAARILAIANDLQLRGLSYAAALADLATLLSHIAIEQRLPGATTVENPLQANIQQLAQQLDSNVLQLFYSVAVHSRSELSLAPDEYAGFVMACLRMLALLPADASPMVASPSNAVSNTQTSPAQNASSAVATAPTATAPTSAEPVSATIPVAPVAPMVTPHIAASVSTTTPPVEPSAPTATPPTAPPVASVAAAAAPPEVTIAAPAAVASASQKPSEPTAAVPQQAQPAASEQSASSSAQTNVASAPSSGAMPPVLEVGGTVLSAHSDSSDDTPPWEASTASASTATSAAAAIAEPETAAPPAAIAALEQGKKKIATNTAVSADAVASVTKPKHSVERDGAQEATSPSAQTADDEHSGAPFDSASAFSEPDYLADIPDDLSAYAGDYNDGFDAEAFAEGESFAPAPEQMADSLSQVLPDTDETVDSKQKKIRLRHVTEKNWPSIAATLPVTGWSSELARQSEWLGVSEEGEITLRANIQAADDSQAKARLVTVLSEYFGQVVRLYIEYGDTGSETAHAVEQAVRAERQAEAERAAPLDPFISQLMQEFDAQIVPGSIRANHQRASVS